MQESACQAAGRAWDVTSTPPKDSAHNRAVVFKDTATLQAVKAFHLPVLPLTLISTGGSRRPVRASFLARPWQRLWGAPYLSPLGTIQWAGGQFRSRERGCRAHNLPGRTGNAATTEAQRASLPTGR